MVPRSSSPEPPRLDLDANLPAPVTAIFEPALRRALRDTPGVRRLFLLPGPRPDEVVVGIGMGGRAPLPLCFPRASAFSTDAVVRAIQDTIERACSLLSVGEKARPRK
jgi:hypothetical protein